MPTSRRRVHLLAGACAVALLAAAARPALADTANTAPDPLDPAVGLFFKVLGVIALLPLALLVVGAIRNELVHLVAAVLRLAATPFVIVCRFLNEARDRLTRRIKVVLKGLAPAKEVDKDHPHHWGGWDVLYPLLLTLAFVALAVADLFVMSLRMGAMLGQTTTSVTPPGGVDLLMGLVWVLSGSLFGLILIELLFSPVGRPWHKLSPAAQQRLRRLCVAGVVLTACGAILANAVGQLMAAGHTGALVVLLSVLVMMLLALLLVGAAALSFSMIFAGVAAIVLLALLVLRMLLGILWLVPRLLVAILAALANVLIWLIDLIAKAFQKVWNWLVRRERCRRWGWGEIIHTDPTPVDDGVDDWLSSPREPDETEPQPASSAVPSGGGEAPIAAEGTEPDAAADRGDAGVSEPAVARRMAASRNGSVPVETC